MPVTHPDLTIEVHEIGSPRPLRRVAFNPAPSAREGVFTAPAGFDSATLVEACRRGFALLPGPGLRAWISPNPRAVMVPRNLDAATALAHRSETPNVYASVDAAFERVVAATALGEDGTWVSDELRRSFSRLHQLGWAHSFEVWTVTGDLVAGLYGLNVGGLFSVERTFSHICGGRELLIAAMSQHCRRIGVTLIDLRVMTKELERIGAMSIPGADYVAWVGAIENRVVSFGGDPPAQTPATFESFPLYINTVI